MKKVQKDKIINNRIIKKAKIIKKKINKKMLNYWKEQKVQTYLVIINKLEKMLYN